MILSNKEIYDIDRWRKHARGFHFIINPTDQFESQSFRSIRITCLEQGRLIVGRLRLSNAFAPYAVNFDKRKAPDITDAEFLLMVQHWLLENADMNEWMTVVNCWGEQEDDES